MCWASPGVMKHVSTAPSKDGCRPIYGGMQNHAFQAQHCTRWSMLHCLSQHAELHKTGIKFR